ncbi:P-loop containing nucleoside triphosphate hydrolase protein [Aureobasidium sp. EXF-12298]|nr:P-loop containing nucleoside triphosphate hydrolase protein [Aureobasidium sp. EXF-12298]
MGSRLADYERSVRMLHLQSIARARADRMQSRESLEYEEGYNSEQSELDALATRTSTGLPTLDLDPTKPKEEPLDPKLVGMSVGYKSLYSGKEDRRGRFQWQETIPEDLVPPAENAETQKWAFIARHVKVYGDPRRTLALHSIVIQSPLLKRVLQIVLVDYPGVTVGLQRLELDGKFECLIHRFPALDFAVEALQALLKHYEDCTVCQDPTKHCNFASAPNGTTDQQQEINDILTRGQALVEDAADNTVENHVSEESAEVKSEDSEDDTASPSRLSNTKLSLKHTQILRDCLYDEFQVLIESSRDMKAQGVITYEALWTIFEPGTLVYIREEGQDRVFNLLSGKYGTDKDGRPVYTLKIRYIDYDGTRFGWIVARFDVHAFEGTCSIASLAAYPIEYHADEADLRKKLINRGSEIEALVGTHYRAYDGIGHKLDMYGQKERHSVKGRIIIDTVGWNRYIPDQAIYTSPLGSTGTDRKTRRSRTLILPGFGESYNEGLSGGMPLDGHFGDEGDLKKLPPLSDEQKLLCTHLIRGFALKEKMWLNMFVGSVQDVSFNKDAFESLVLPADTKELILGFTSTQQATRIAYDDVIEGKGRGIILLLCGPPGVGKTLTAESVAEHMQVPLFVMSAGDLGSDSRQVEASLISVLGKCTRWNAILLLDEADIFLEERSRHEVERNKLVSIFLRVLEYHEGIMFLTTNRVSTFDPAFQSRIHISIDYPELSPDSRRKIWENFLGRHNDAQAAARLKPPQNPASSIRSAAAILDETCKSPEKEKHESLTQPHAITQQEIRQLSLLRLNGRQIKNMLKTAQLLASFKAEPLGHKHIKTVLDATQHLHNANKVTEDTRSSIFN